MKHNLKVHPLSAHTTQLLAGMLTRTQDLIGRAQEQQHRSDDVVDIVTQIVPQAFMDGVYTALKHSKKHLNFLVAETSMQELCLGILSSRENRSQYHMKLCLIALNIQRELIDNGMVEQVVQTPLIECLKSIILIEAANVDPYLLSATLDLLNAIIQHQPVLLSKMEAESQLAAALIHSLNRIKVESSSELVLTAYRAEGGNPKYNQIFEPQIYSYVQLNERLQMIANWIQIYNAPAPSRYQAREQPQNSPLQIAEIFSESLMSSIGPLLIQCSAHIEQLQCVDEQKLEAWESFLQIFTGLDQKLCIRGTQLMTVGF